jgi:hypothetical protein
MEAKSKEGKHKDSLEEKIELEVLSTADFVKEKIKSIEAMLSEPTKNISDNVPPKGLSAEDEVLWWNNRIAHLSQPIEISDSKSECSYKAINESKFRKSDK